MIEYMEQVSRQFELCSGWNRENSYENVTATSENLLNFRIPSALKVQVSNNSSPYTFTTFELSNSKVINGSLAYLFTDCEGLKQAVKGSRTIPLQEAAETYRHIRPLNLSRRQDFFIKDEKARPGLFYGRMYYPSSILEAMIVKRFSSYTQFVMKCVSSLSQSSILTLYWQRDSGQNSQEWIFSTNEVLFGYRLLHNFAQSQSKLDTALYNNSSLSLGAEFWFGLLNTSPACSTTLRYSTHSTNTGRPLTLTLSWNPLFGHISSTYSVKTGYGTSFCSKYDFNLYSIDSNLSFGCEVWRGRRNVLQGTSSSDIVQVPEYSVKQMSDADRPDNWNAEIKAPMYYHLLAAPSPKNPDEVASMNIESTVTKVARPQSKIENFARNLYHTDFTNVWKLSTSLRDKNLRVLWEGKYKGFLLSIGTEFTSAPISISSNVMDAREARAIIRPSKFGLQLQYSL
ncbi:LAMI_0F07118g1_1 [Lachancea mirantina]|uniref:Mitochondrial distribution and morphology protein 10 n=1 Tax=Lachancea mirantina TaxID=1230905 RepID=A0A1G4JZF0_9SACH|nr:LAMI_0F07118g1_1 [Lachancea mirantina]